MSEHTDRERLLEASPDQLAGLDPEWRELLAADPGLRSDAERLLAASKGLDTLLDTPPLLDVDEVLRRARITAVDGGREATDDRPGSTTKRVAALPRQWLHRGGWVAAAAAVAALVFTQVQPESALTDRGFTPQDVRPSSPGPLLQVGTDAAVLPTRNPDITVVWFFTGE